MDKYSVLVKVMVVVVLADQAVFEAGQVRIHKTAQVKVETATATVVIMVAVAADLEVVGLMLVVMVVKGPFVLFTE